MSLYSLHVALKNLQAVYFLQITELLLEELGQHYLPLLNKLETTSPKKKRRKSKDGGREKRNKMTVVWCTHCVVDLLSVVLSEAPIDIFGKGRQVGRAGIVLDSLLGNVFQQIMTLARDDVRFLDWLLLLNF